MDILSDNHRTLSMYLEHFHKIFINLQCVKNLGDFFDGSCMPGIDKPENNPRGKLQHVYAFNSSLKIPLLCVPLLNLRTILVVFRKISMDLGKMSASVLGDDVTKLKKQCYGDSNPAKCLNEERGDVAFVSSKQ